MLLHPAFAMAYGDAGALQVVREHPVLITVEEGSIGGFAAHVMQFLALEGKEAHLA